MNLLLCLCDFFGDFGRLLVALRRFSQAYIYFTTGAFAMSRKMAKGKARAYYSTNKMRGENMKKRTLCVIFGGKSNEYEVSLRSAYEVLSNIDGEKYDVIMLGITKNGEWYIFEGGIEEILNDTWHKGHILPVTLDLSSGHLIVLERDIYARDVDVFFPVMHGETVEDGRIQGLFDIAGVKYVGCGAFASHICMDKGLTRNEAIKCGIPVASGIVLNKKSYGRVDKIDFPVFIKPCMGGSSIGVTRATNKEELNKGIELAFSYCDNILIENAIEGEEIEVAVIETKGGLLATSVGMVRHGREVYDYEAKYRATDIEYLIPAPIDEKTEKYARECAKKLFLALGCKGLSRIDFFVTGKKEVIFNEVNTMPGFTRVSMYPKLIMQIGYTYEKMLDTLIEGAHN